MPTSVGPNTYGEENLVFGYDLGDASNSYRGEPTTNFAYLHNGRKDSSYTSYMPESGTGQIAALHPGAIQVYNQNGSDISYYLNTGINIENSGVNWYDTNHAYWVYDEVLKKPVVQMIDRNGVWQAKYMGIGLNWTDMGLTAGDQYTISWLQWSSDGVKRAHAGLYWYDTTAGYSSFWDGLSDTGNTTPQTWTRVSQTFTLSSGRSLDQSLTWYMYGMYYSRATLRIADVQLEKKSHKTQFSFANTRSATQGLQDLTGNSTIDLTNVSFDSNAQVDFDGSNDYASLGNPTILRDLTSGTIETVYYRDASTGTYQMIFTDAGSDLEITYSGNVLQFYIGNSGLNYTHAVTGQWFHVAGTWDASSKKIYLNGVEVASGTNTGIDTGNRDRYVGGRGTSFPFNGKIPMVKVYTRTLTASEVKSNFNAIKGRFNI